MGKYYDFITIATLHDRFSAVDLIGRVKIWILSPYSMTHKMQLYQLRGNIKVFHW